MMYFIVFLIVVIVINVVLANFMVRATELKGYGPDAHVFGLVFWTGWFGCLYAIALPDLNLRKQNEEILARLGKTAAAEKLPEI